MTDCCVLIVSPRVGSQEVPQVCVSAHVWTVCVPFQVILTVPMRWPALRVHTKVPVPCNMVLMQDWGALSWSLMVWLTVGMYGNSITDSKQDIFTDTPVTVPARCLKRRSRDQSVRQIMKINVQILITAPLVGCRQIFLLRIDFMNPICAKSNEPFLWSEMHDCEWWSPFSKGEWSLSNWEFTRLSHR